MTQSYGTSIFRFLMNLPSSMMVVLVYTPTKSVLGYICPYIPASIYYFFDSCMKAIVTGDLKPRCDSYWHLPDG